MGTLVLLLIFKDHFSLLSMVLAVVLSPMTFIILRYSSLYTQFVESFFHKSILNFVRSFFYIYSDHDFYFPVVNMVHHIDWFVDIEQFLDSGINSTWSWCMFLFMYCWIWFVNILLRILTYNFMIMLYLGMVSSCYVWFY